MPRRAALAAAAAALAGAEAWRRGFLNVVQQDDDAAPPKRRGVSVDEVRQQLRVDLAERQYPVSGELSPAIFSDDCLFLNPLTRVRSLTRYRAALKQLFDPEKSLYELESIDVVDERHINAIGYVSGKLMAVPWQPSIARFRVEATYTLDATGLIVQYEERPFDARTGKSLSGVDIFRQTLFGS